MGTVGRVQLQHWVSQRIGYPKRAERRSDGSQNDLFGIIARDDETADQHLSVRQHSIRVEMFNGWAGVGVGVEAATYTVPIIPQQLPWVLK